jgi:hypothetical protein
MAAAPTPHAGSRATSLSVRVGVAALLLLFYVDAFLRTGLWSTRVLFGVLLVPAAIGLIVTTRDLPSALRPRAADIAFALVAALAVAVGVRELGLAPVVAAALVGVVAAITSTLHNRLASAAVPLYCGAFAGMTSELVLAEWPAVAFAGLVAGVLVSLLRATWDGVGGKLGLLAFGGVFLTTLVARAFGAMGSGAPVLELDRADRFALIAVAPIAAAVTWALRHRGISPVMASAAPTAVFALVLLALDDRTPVGDVMPFAYTPLCVAWFGGSFIGMTAPGRVGGRLWPLLIAATLFGVLQIGFKPRIAGFGGDFGASAAVAVLVLLGVIELARLAGTWRQEDGPPTVPEEPPG